MVLVHEGGEGSGTGGAVVVEVEVAAFLASESLSGARGFAAVALVVLLAAVDGG